MDEKLEQELKDFLRQTASEQDEEAAVDDLIGRLTDEWSPLGSGVSRVETRAIAFVMTVLVNRLPLSELTTGLFELGRAFERIRGDDANGGG